MLRHFNVQQLGKDAHKREENYRQHSSCHAGGAKGKQQGTLSCATATSSRAQKSKASAHFHEPEKRPSQTTLLSPTHPAAESLTSTWEVDTGQESWAGMRDDQNV